MAKRNQVVQGYINAFIQYNAEGIAWTKALKNQNINNSYPYINLCVNGEFNIKKAERIANDIISISNKCNNGNSAYLSLCKMMVIRYNLMDGAMQRDMECAVKLLDIPFDKSEPTDSDLIRMISERGLTCENGKWYKTTRVEIH